MLKDRMTSVAPEGTVQIKARKRHGAHPPPSGFLASNGVSCAQQCACACAESSLELPPGSGIHWEFQLASKDIGFSVKFERVKEDGSAEEEVVVPYDKLYAEHGAVNGVTPSPCTWPMSDRVTLGGFCTPRGFWINI